MRTTPLALTLMPLLGISTFSSMTLADVIAKSTDRSGINATDKVEKQDQSAGETTKPQPEVELSRVIVESSLEDVYLQPNAESSISAQQFQIHHNGNINQMLRDSAGVYTLEAPTNPGVVGGFQVMVEYLCREYGISSATFYKWRSKYGCMDASMITQLKELEAENAKLKKMYAEEYLKSRIRQEALEGKW